MAQPFTIFFTTSDQAVKPHRHAKVTAECVCYSFPAKYQLGHQYNPPKFLIFQLETDPLWIVNTQHELGLRTRPFFRAGVLIRSCPWINTCMNQHRGLCLVTFLKTWPISICQQKLTALNQGSCFIPSCTFPFILLSK